MRSSICDSGVLSSSERGFTRIQLAAKRPRPSSMRQRAPLPMTESESAR